MRAVVHCLFLLVDLRKVCAHLSKKLSLSPPSTHTTFFFFFSGTAKVSWENETMHVLATVFGVLINPSPQS